MRIILVLLVFICSLAMSNGTLKLLKSKLKGTPVIYPAASYRTLKYLSSPIVISEPLPETYAHSVFISTYSSSSPSITTDSHVAPIHTYSSPYAYASTYAAPAYIYPRPIKVAYDVSTIEPEIVYVERILSHGGSAVKGYYSV